MLGNRSTGPVPRVDGSRALQRACRHRGESCPPHWRIKVNKRLAVAGALLVLKLLTTGLHGRRRVRLPPQDPQVPGRPAPRAYDVTRGYHRVLRVAHRERFVAVRGVPRFRVVRRAHRYVFLRRASRAVVRASTNGVIAAGTPVSVGLPAPPAAPGREPRRARATTVRPPRLDGEHARLPQWWMVDLGSDMTVTGLRADWSDAAKRAYRYRVEASVNGTTFTTIRDRSKNQAKGATTDTVTATARYVRVHVWA